MTWGPLAMKVFIGAVIVLGLFGPHMISIMLGALCVAIWYYCRNDKDTAGRKW